MKTGVWRHSDAASIMVQCRNWEGEAVVEERVERKLSAILVADVVGYSRLVGADEEGTLAQLKECRRAVVNPKIDEHRGRIVKTTGDGMLVQFASVVDALRCAVEVQRGMVERNAEVPQERRIEFRIGINVGDIIIDEDDIYGDGVNIAARLEGLAEPGGICVSLGVRDQVRDKLDVTFEDAGEQRLKNIAWPVRVYRVRLSGGTATLRPALAVAGKPSIAVLPFDNMSGDPDQQYFSDGITEDIITELSRFQQLFVIARHSSFQYRDKAGDVLRIGRELNVQYVVEGSIRNTGDRIRIAAQLIDAERGVHIWVERYDSSLAELFSVQDEVTKRIVAALAVRVEEEDWSKARRKPPDSMRAYDFWLRGKRNLDLYTREGNLEARRLFQIALEIDPEYARAHAGLALTYDWGGFYSAWDPEPMVSYQRAEHHAKQAVALDDTDSVPHVTLGWIHHGQRQFEQARRHFERAMAINPNDANTLANFAMSLAFSGEAVAAIDLAQAAVRLNPRSPHWYQCYLAGCYLCAQKYLEAITIWERMPDATPETRAFLSAACVFVGKMEEARQHMAEFIRTYPQHWAGEACARSLRELFEFRNKEDIDRLIGAMRQAGLPE